MKLVANRTNANGFTKVKCLNILMLEKVMIYQVIKRSKSLNTKLTFFPIFNRNNIILVANLPIKMTQKIEVIEFSGERK